MSNNKSKFLKNLLSTVSSLIIITGGTNNALGNNYSVASTHGSLSTPAVIFHTAPNKSIGFLDIATPADANVALPPSSILIYNPLANFRSITIGAIPDPAAANAIFGFNVAGAGGAELVFNGLDTDAPRTFTITSVENGGPSNLFDIRLTKPHNSAGLPTATDVIDNIIELNCSNEYFGKITTESDGKGMIVIGLGKQIIFNEDVGTSILQLNSLTLQDKRSTVTFVKDAFFKGDITLGKGNTLVAKSNLKAELLQSVASSNAILRFENTAAAKLVLTKAGTEAVGKIIAAGKDLEISLPSISRLALNKITSILESTTTDAQIITLANLNLGSTNIVSAGNNTLTLKVDGDQNISGKIGAVDHLVNIETKGDHNITITTKEFFSSLFPTTANQGKVSIGTKDATVYGSLGNSTNRFNIVTFTDDNNVKGEVFSKAVNIDANKTVNFHSTVSGDVLTLLGSTNNSTAAFDGNVLIDIVSSTSRMNKARFLGLTATGNTIQKIGTAAMPLELAMFGLNTGHQGNFILTGDVYATDAKFLNSIASTDAKDIIFGSKATGNKTFFITNKGKLTFQEGAEIKNGGFMTRLSPIILSTSATGTPQNYILTGDSVIFITLDAAGSHQPIEVATNATFNATGAKTLRFGVRSDYKVIDFKPISIKFVNGTGGTIIALNKKNTLCTYDILNKDMQIVLHSFSKVVGDPKNVFEAQVVYDGVNGMVEMLTANNASATVIENGKILMDPRNTGDALALINEVVILADDNHPEAIQELLTRVSSVAITGSETVKAAIRSTTNAISSRLDAVTAPSNPALTGVASGDQIVLTTNHGAWVTPFYGQATQKQKDSTDGYKSTARGATVGFDTVINDATTIGVAVTIGQTNFKHKDVHAGDKAKVDTKTFSVYGLHQMANNFFVQGIASVGSHSVKTDSKRVVASTKGPGYYKDATGKYDVTSYGVEVMTGYNHKIANFAILTPMIGLGYTRTGDSDYTETGSTHQNQVVKSKGVDRVEIIAGAKASMPAMDMSGVIVTPELRTMIRHSLTNQKSAPNTALKGLFQPFVQGSEKASRTSYQIGVGVTARSGMIEYGASYDIDLASKYVGHLGTLKVRVIF